MKNRGSTPNLTNAVGVHPRNIHTKFEANPCSGLRGEVEKLKSSRRQQRQRRQRQRQRRRRRRTQPDRYSHTHSLSVTKKHIPRALLRAGTESQRITQNLINHRH